MSELYLRDLWKNTNVPYLFNRVITEYDMERAGLNLIREYQLLPAETIKKLESLGKHDCDVAIGTIQRKDKVFAKHLTDAFAIARKEFYNANGLEEEHIISIKKDAIFTSKECNRQRIGKHINFRSKHQYSSYMKIGRSPELELLYQYPTIEVKGMSDEAKELHKDGFLKFLVTFFHKAETEPGDRILRYLRTMIDRYKELSLPMDYYREFNSRSSYVVLNGETYGDYWEEEKENLDIHYNYQILCNLCKIFL